MAESVYIPRPTRQQISAVMRGDEAMTRALEALFNGLQFAPESIQAAQDAADAAAVDAAAAQATADGAELVALAAQAEVNALETAPFVTIGAASGLPNERALGVGLGISLVDGGPNTTVTLDRSDLVAVLPADVADITAAFVDATGLTVALAANATYLVDALLTFQAAAVTTGLALGFTLPAGATISGMYQHNTTATAREGSYNIAAGAVKGNTTAVLVAAENVPLQARWLIKTAATAGAAQLQFRTEVAASAVTLKAGLSAVIAQRLV